MKFAQFMADCWQAVANWALAKRDAWAETVKRIKKERGL